MGSVCTPLEACTLRVCVVDRVFEEVKLFHWTTLEQPLVADRFWPNAAKTTADQKVIN